ncbi:MAG: tRNA (N(6)-L-threonylcarbamoyladenosine(37)-C(2))-methylthiotransferase MtaB [Deltaproteobacteria bacterium]|nr:tRNA (N(6)-L-threonylcarbamoyladenosine(37)-C(2))-methylthiotransferase MtaB [Deltaproteobacteria bacterium]
MDLKEHQDGESARCLTGAPGGAIFKVAVTTLGCKVNQCESAGITAAIAARGMALVPFEAEADCYIINTCTVTGKTDSQSRQLIRRAIRRNPAALILVTGCYAQRAPEEIVRIPGVRIVAGNAEKATLIDLIEQAATDPGPQVRVGDIAGEKGFATPGATVFPEHTRAFLKIQDGCDAFCTYCIVPAARGRSRSLPEAEVAQRISALAGQGFREVVLTGIHLGVYGRDLTPPGDLTALVQKIAAARPVERLRLSSIEPREVTDALLALMDRPGILCRHLHIPLQSGDDGILAAMHRNYDRVFFRNLIVKIRGSLPDLAIGIDVMTGFPGETDAAFGNTLQLVEELPIAYLHVFPYSQRPGTPAAELPNQISEEEKKRRALLLRKLGTAKRRAFAEPFLGRELTVLIEGKEEAATGLFTGFSDNYIPVAVRGNVDANQIVRVRPQSFRNGRLLAEVIHG